MQKGTVIVVALFIETVTFTLISINEYIHMYFWSTKMTAFGKIHGKHNRGSKWLMITKINKKAQGHF
jgi:hypothetical protein